MPLDISKDVYIFDITGEIDHGIEQRPALRNIGLQRGIELFDINGAVVLTFPFIAFYKETITIVNLKTR